MITIQLLRQDQLRQVAEWEFGPQPPDTDWERYAAEMNTPKWIHCGLYAGGEFVGAISWERINPQTMAYHVVTARHKVGPHGLAQVLLKSVAFFFRRGFTALVAEIPKRNIAAARLALRCGMKEEKSNDESFRYFALRRSRLNS